MNRVVHFEIGAEDPDRASDFYKKTFGWEIKKIEEPYPYWLVMTGNEKERGIDGGIYKRETKPAESTDSNNAINFVCTIDTQDIDQTIDHIIENGGRIINEKMELEGVGLLAYAKDTEGNLFGVMQSFPMQK